MQNRLRSNTGRAMVLGFVVLCVTVCSAQVPAPKPQVLGPDSILRISSAMARKNLVKSAKPVMLGDEILKTTQTVQLAVRIGKDGKVETAHVLSGLPFLISAAVQAVSKYQYKPYVLDHQAYRVETVVNVEFPPTVKQR